jgi:hypothetical protein
VFLGTNLEQHAAIPTKVHHGQSKPTMAPTCLWPNGCSLSSQSRRLAAPSEVLRNASVPEMAFPSPSMASAKSPKCQGIHWRALVCIPDSLIFTDEDTGALGETQLPL